MKIPSVGGDQSSHNNPIDPSRDLLNNVEAIKNFTPKTLSSSITMENLASHQIQPNFTNNLTTKIADLASHSL